MKFSPAVVNALPYTADALQKPAAKPVAPTEKESSTTEQLLGGFDLNVGAPLSVSHEGELLAYKAAVAIGKPELFLQYLLEEKKIDFHEKKFSITAGAIAAITGGDADRNMQAMMSIYRESNTVNVDLQREHENVNLTEQAELLAARQMVASGESQACRYVLQYVFEKKTIDYHLTNFRIIAGAIVANTGADADCNIQALMSIYRESNTVNVDLQRENENVNSDITELKRQLVAEQRAHQATKLELKDSLERQLADEKALREKEAAEHQALLNSDELEVGDDEKAE